ncbi:hypothetical protein HWI79_319 [Cryptosporidium felis]|nr:hypothetical protein HWI79_319 [Cryptosporidium felis]
MQDEISISHFRKGAEVVINQLGEICGGSNPKLKLGLSGPSLRSSSPNTLSGILKQYSDSVNQGEGVGYIGLEWKGPFPLHNTILQHIKRVQLLIGKPPSLIYGIVPHIRYGFVGLENLLYLFPLNEFVGGVKRRESSIASSLERRNRANSITSNIAQDLDGNEPVCDESILTLTFPFSIKNLSGTFPRIGIFRKDVEYLLCVITDKSIHLVALKFDKTMQNQIQSDIGGPESSILKGAGLAKIPILSIGGKDISTLQCSLPGSFSSDFHSLHGTIDGRFFFLEENSPSIHELVYQSKEGWITPYCYVHSHQLYTSLTKELLLKYTFLRLMPRSFSIKKISLTPCGFMAILDSAQNVYLAAYLNDIDDTNVLSLLAPWGRVVNSLGYWASNLHIKPCVLPSDWDEYTSCEGHQESVLSANKENNFNNFSSKDFKEEFGKFSSPGSLKVISVLRKRDFQNIISKIPGGSSFEKKVRTLKMNRSDKTSGNHEINDLQLSFSSDYNLALSVFTNNGTRLQFQCSKRLYEEMPSIDSVINGFGFESDFLGSPKKKFQPEKFPHTPDSEKTSDELVFGFWLTYVLPPANIHNPNSITSKSYYKNGLTVFVRNTASHYSQGIGPDIDSSKLPDKIASQIELRLFNSLPADVGAAPSSNLRKMSLNGFNSPTMNLRYNGNFCLDGQNAQKGEPIIIEVEEQIRAIYEFVPDMENSGNNSNGSFQALSRLEGSLSSDVVLEYGCNPFGKGRNQHDLLGWVKERCIIFVGETGYFFLVLRWNGLQQIIGASGLFMQLLQCPLNGNSALTAFRRLVHPEDSFLTNDHLTLTSPWIEALSGAIAFELKIILELPLFFKRGDDYSSLLCPRVLERSLPKLQSLINILSRSQNIIGGEVFDVSLLPNLRPSFGRLFGEILAEEMCKDQNVCFKDYSTFLLKSLTYITNMLLQLVQFLIIFSTVPLELRRLTFRNLGKNDLNCLSEMPVICLVISNKGVCQIRNLVESFSRCILESVSYSEGKLIDFKLLNQVKILYKTGWLNTRTSNCILRRLALISDLFENPTNSEFGMDRSGNPILDKISSRESPPIGGFTLQPYRYWEIFQSDPTQNGFLREIFSSLLLQPLLKVEESTLLLLDCISHFELLIAEKLNLAQGFSDSHNRFESISQSYSTFSLYIEHIIRSWSDSLRETFLELMDRSPKTSVATVRSGFLLVFYRPLNSLFASCPSLKIFKLCVKYLMREVLPLILDRYCNLFALEEGFCSCQVFLDDLVEFLRLENSQIPSSGENSILALIVNSFSKLFGPEGTNDRLNYNWDNISSYISDLITETNYSPFLFVNCAIYTSSHFGTSGSIKSASLLSEFSLNDNITCGASCKNINSRIYALKITKINYFSQNFNSTEVNVLRYFPRLFNVDKSDGYLSIDYSLRNAISIVDGIISTCNNLQIPLLNYISKLPVSQNPTLFQLFNCLSRRIYSLSEMLSTINSTPYIEPFIIIATLMEVNSSHSRSDDDLEASCNVVSDLLLQILLPPGNHIIFSLFPEGTERPYFPILTHFFGLSNIYDLSDSIYKLFEFIQSPLLNLTGSSFLGSLSVAPKTYLSVGLSNQEIFEKYDLFQQIYSITAILEFSNYYLSKTAENKALDLDPLFPTQISIQFWKKRWSVPFDLLFEVYLSLLDSTLTSNPQTDPFLLIYNRLSILESPIFTSEPVTKNQDLFALHIRKCATGVLLEWLENRDSNKFNSTHIAMSNNFVSNFLGFLQTDCSPDHSKKLLETLRNIQLKLESILT